MVPPQMNESPRSARYKRRHCPTTIIHTNLTDNDSKCNTNDMSSQGVSIIMKTPKHEEECSSARVLRCTPARQSARSAARFAIEHAQLKPSTNSEVVNNVEVNTEKSTPVKIPKHPTENARSFARKRLISTVTSSQDIDQQTGQDITPPSCTTGILTSDNNHKKIIKTPKKLSTPVRSSPRQRSSICRTPVKICRTPENGVLTAESSPMRAVGVRGSPRNNKHVNYTDHSAVRRFNLSLKRSTKAVLNQQVEDIIVKLGSDLPKCVESTRSSPKSNLFTSIHCEYASSLQNEGVTSASDMLNKTILRRKRKKKPHKCRERLSDKTPEKYDVNGINLSSSITLGILSTQSMVHSSPTLGPTQCLKLSESQQTPEISTPNTVTTLLIPNMEPEADRVAKILSSSCDNGSVVPNEIHLISKCESVVNHILGVTQSTPKGELMLRDITKEKQSTPKSQCEIRTSKQTNSTPKGSIGDVQSTINDVTSPMNIDAITPRTSRSVKTHKLDKSWSVLSDRSMLRLLSANSDSSDEFEGFVENSQTLPVDVSYDEISHVDVSFHSDYSCVLEDEHNVLNGTPPQLHAGGVGRQQHVLNDVSNKDVSENRDLSHQNVTSVVTHVTDVCSVRCVKENTSNSRVRSPGVRTKVQSKRSRSLSAGLNINTIIPKSFACFDGHVEPSPKRFFKNASTIQKTFSLSYVTPLNNSSKSNLHLKNKTAQVPLNANPFVTVARCIEGGGKIKPDLDNIESSGRVSGKSSHIVEKYNVNISGTSNRKLKRRLPPSTFMPRRASSNTPAPKVVPIYNQQYSPLKNPTEARTRRKNKATHDPYYCEL